MRKLWVCMAAILCLFGCSSSSSASNAQIDDYSKLLYKISDQEGNYGYLLGTIHLNQAEIKQLDKTTQKVLDESNALALEIDMDQSQASDYAYMFTQQPVSETFSKKELKRLKKIIKEYPSVPKEGYENFNLGTLNLLSSQDIVKAAGFRSEYAIDSYLYYKCNQEKKKFYEFETYQDQLQMFVELGIICKDLMLDVMEQKDEAVKGMKELAKWYRKGDIETLEKNINTSMDSHENPTLKQENIMYQNKMIYERNDVMSEKMKIFISSPDTVFAAVGAGHVLGERGILKQLEAQGYIIEWLGKQ